MVSNNSTRWRCEHCGRTNVIIQNQMFDIVLCPLCNELFKEDIETVIRKYKVNSNGTEID